MGLHLIAASWLDGERLWLIGQVVLGLCSVIFIHELGHFAVAKACGVKCEKFYLFFDLFGWKLFRFRWGETEYGFGWLPLGGYVKMLGQDDDPRKAAAELERARAQTESGDASPSKPAFDPRSYLAKSVWQRMAIISAGVIMNVIFAFVLASIALSSGVNEEPCVIGSTAPGDPAWQAGLEPGDRVIEIAGVKKPLFKDLRTGVVFGDEIERGVKFVIAREGRSEPLEFNVRPQTRSIFPMIGVTSAHILELRDPPTPDKLSPAHQLEEGLAAGDIIVAVGDVKVDTAADLEREFHRHTGAVRLKVRRPDNPILETFRTQAEFPPGKDLEFEIPPTPMKTLGFGLEAGPIVRVQDGSPAAKAGLQNGDRLVSIDGQPIEDALYLPEMLRDKERATIVWRRPNLTPSERDFTAAAVSGLWQRAFEIDYEEFQQEIDLRPDLWVESPYLSGQKLTAPTLGVAIEVLNRVATVATDGPAAAAGLKPGDEIVMASVLPAPKEVQEKYESSQSQYDLELGSTRLDFPLFFTNMQHALPGSKVVLKLADEREATIEPVEAQNWFNPDRGLAFKALYQKRSAEGLGEALSMGWRETTESLGMVYRFLQKLASRQVSVKSLGGPVEIAQGAYSSADRGWPELLLFLTMLSANLAVINFLPIPVLDGGHIVFLAYEAIRGKPPNDRIAGPLTWLGFLFLISLMLFVFGMSFGIIPRFG